ncbi:right-handed parallel beta-helix repeat-containing protein [Paracoccus aurantiacus]|uniref:Right-handed parallel beta-helix repeat-containing protein n=1 Tax=Paracoccus aurantiacus TaxID=2599412 RepID=A0A5C6S843_9RHOB|nr:glycosyl hydrolase family 28-related protein [Paracoccus aurantiacus]TXB70560.1 right-handed parallel beta-helix repeat-containing protein [Paracoccus aurantiacus]
MNIAITDGLQLMPPSFAAGLSAWSREYGTPGSATWANQLNAAIVSADPDFGSCLEINKVADVTRIRFMGETPILPGTYLRISARVKAIAGPRPAVRVAGWAGDGGRNHVTGLVEEGAPVNLPTYGEVVEVSAIVGTGKRSGVNMPWGSGPIYGHFGIDLVGGNGGALRIESVKIEDVTSVFLRQMMDIVDVRDYGAIGNGTTDDAAAFAAADKAAKGRVLVVPDGVYRIASDLTIASPVRFTGTLTMPRAARLTLMGSFDYPSYAAAFGDETEALKRALQALFGYTDHAELNLRGRRIDLKEPLIMSEIAPGLSDYGSRRLICNGQIRIVDGSSWNTGTASSQATYETGQPTTLNNVANVANIEVGSLVTGPGVGREVYVQSKNIAARSIVLSQPLYGGSGTRNYQFRRFRYMFDFLGVDGCSRVNFSEIEFILDGRASFLMLPQSGQMFHVRDCFISGPSDRGITSVGRACQDLLVDRCQFLSSEMGVNAQDRTSIAININANDAKIRENRFVRFGTFMVATGTGHLISGNHWFQGDDTAAGKRVPGLVIAQKNCKMAITGNYVDNNVIEWTNEYDALPNFGPDEYSFGGLSISGNHFTVKQVLSDFAWISIRPYGTGHHIHGLTVSNNVFLVIGPKIQRIDKVDTTFADLDYSRMRNILFDGNTFNGVLNYVANPVQITHTQTSAQSSWVVQLTDCLPFKAWARNVDSVTAVSMIQDANNGRITEMPWVRTEQGAARKNLQIEWSKAAKGKVVVRARMDSPD